MTTRYDKYRAAGSMGWKTISLFADVLENPEESAKADYWLNRNKTGDKRLVMRDYFMEYEDMSGSKVAHKFLGNMEHFNKMYENSPWFRDSVDMWRMELAGILRERAMTRVMEIMAEANDATSLSAAKFLVDRLDPKEDPKRGRPSKVEVSGELKRQVKTIEETDADWDRITGHIN